MNQADAERRIEELETRNRQRDLRPLLESLAAQTGVAADDIVAEAERLRATYGTNIMEIEAGIAWELGMTIEQVRTEVEHTPATS